MVDYFAIKADCPSIAFFFAHLGSLLEFVEGECLEGISSFVGKDYPYTSVLSSLFPLVSHSTEVARLLRMSKVRSSDLEMGLSLSDDRVVSGATYVSTPYKAWNISCSLSEKDEKRIRDRFQFPDSVKIRIPSDEERACHSYVDEFCFYEMSTNEGDVIRRDEFLHFYRLRKSKDPGYYEFKSWERASRMTTRFSKQKLAKVQEKKAKGGTVSDLLSKKKTSKVVKEEVRKKKKSGGKSFLPTFWDDADVAALKAHEVLFVDNLNSLMAKLSSEGGSLQALGESLFISGKFLDLEKKVTTSDPLIKSLFAENETFKNKVAILTIETENDKERVDFKDSDEYSDDLCKYYVEGFDLLVKWMAKHHPGSDLSGLTVEDAEKELMSDRSSEATAENMTEEATDIAEEVNEAIVVTPVDPVPEDQ
nr:hypothetical protein CFP56_08571 [Quercus suber]